MSFQVGLGHPSTFGRIGAVFRGGALPAAICVKEVKKFKAVAEITIDNDLPEKKMI